TERHTFVSPCTLICTRTLSLHTNVTPRISTYSLHTNASWCIQTSTLHRNTSIHSYLESWLWTGAGYRHPPQQSGESHITMGQGRSGQAGTTTRKTLVDSPASYLQLFKLVVFIRPIMSRLSWS